MGVTATVDLHPGPPTTDGSHEATLIGSYQVTCSIDDAETTYGWGEIALLASVTVGTEKGVSLNGQVSGNLTGAQTKLRSGELKIVGTIAGARITPIFKGVYCHHGQENSELIDVPGTPVVIPPIMDVLTAYSVTKAYQPSTPGSEYCPLAMCDEGAKGHLGPMAIWLAPKFNAFGTESAVIHIENAGVSYTEVRYGNSPDPMYKCGPLVLVPTYPGELKVWVESRPTQIKSNIVVINIEDDGREPMSFDYNTCMAVPAGTAGGNGGGGAPMEATGGNGGGAPVGTTGGGGTGGKLGISEAGGGGTGGALGVTEAGGGVAGAESSSTAGASAAPPAGGSGCSTGGSGSDGAWTLCLGLVAAARRRRTACGAASRALTVPRA